MPMKQVIKETPEKEYITLEDIRMDVALENVIFISIAIDKKISFLVMLDRKYRWAMDQDSYLSVITPQSSQSLVDALNYKLNLKETVYRFDNTIELFSYMAEFKRRKNSVSKL